MTQLELGDGLIRCRICGRDRLDTKRVDGGDVCSACRKAAKRGSARPWRAFTRERILAELIEWQDCDDPEEAHGEADDLLLELIDDEEIAAAYKTIKKYCA